MFKCLNANTELLQLRTGLKEHKVMHFWWTQCGTYLVAPKSLSA